MSVCTPHPQSTTPISPTHPHYDLDLPFEKEEYSKKNMGQSQSTNTGKGDSQIEDGSDHRADYYKLLDLERDASEEEQVLIAIVLVFSC
jgi:hypothetical protein